MPFAYPKELAHFQVNELRPEFVGLHARNPGLANNSPSRSTMFSSHESQHLVAENMDIPITLSGTEVEYSKYTTSSRIPFDARVVQVIEKYPRGVSENNLKFNPETIVIIEDVETGEYDYVTIPYHVSYHQYFGYKNQIKDTVKNISPGAFLAKDTVLADTPGNIGKFYTSTTNLNVALIAEAGVAEDGIIICEDVLPRLKFKVYERRTVSLGSRKFPVKISGGPDEYKCFVDIGDYTDESGALMFLREYAEGISPVLMSKSATQKVDYTFDEPIYARQGFRGKVVDVEVIGNTEMIKCLPPQMAEQFEKYRKAGVLYYEELLRCENKIFRECKSRYNTDRPKLSGRLHRLLVRARALTNHDRGIHKKPVQLLNKKNPLDEYQVTFVVEYEITPDIGFKGTSLSGDLDF